MKITNLDLLNVAISPKSLTRSQWIELYKHLETVECSAGRDSDLFRLLDVLRTNQAKIEVYSNYCCYYNPDDEITEGSVPLDL